MSPERWQRIQEVLLAALERTSAAREAFLAEACGRDRELLAQVRSLLQAHEEAGSFLREDPFPSSSAALLASGRAGQIRRLFDEVVHLPEDERQAYLDRVCPDDNDLRRDMEALLQAGEHATDVLRWLDAPSRADPLIRRTLSHYEILDRLGGGGMGVVYRARDTRLGRIVALKLLPSHVRADEAAKARLLHEARAASALDHVNICTIHEIGETGEGELFIAMAYYAGETLKKKVAEGALPVHEALDYTLQVAQGLVKAHEQGVVHRDVKPANVMVTDDGVVKLLDFGLAKATDVSLTKSGAVMGTVAYMSPEQARGEIVDHRTDIWSLGVTLYELLAGQRPFQGDYAQAIAYAIVHDEPLSLTRLRPEVPAMLEEVVGRALAKRPADRYDQARALIRDLQQVRQAAQNATTGPATGSSAPVHRVAWGQLLPEGERVQATVVVSNLGGYVDLVEQLGPEELEHAMRRIRDRAAEIVRHYGGVINRFGGEEMVVLFGIPTPREDDCRRAAHAVLALHDGLRAHGGDGRGPELRLRSGIATGLVAARSLNRGEQPYRIAGRPLQVSSTLAMHAEADEVLVSPETRRLLDPFFETERRSPLPLKGQPEPVAPARLVGEGERRSRFDAADGAGLTGFMGREEELETLRRWLRQVVAGEGQFVTVMGEAGLGKSRLLYEFRQGLDRDRLTLLQGRCSSYGDRASFLPFVEVLSDHFDVAPESPEPEDGDRVVARILELAPELDVYVPLYLHLLSMPGEAYPLPEHLEGPQLHRALLEALAAAFTLSTRHGPLVLLLEDWHWADEASRAVLDQLVELIPAYPLLVVVTYRPDDVPGWGLPAHQTQIRLRPLETPASIEMMKSVLQAAHFPEPVSALLHERTGGNPFFLEEICQALREEGTLRVEEGRVILTRSMDTLQLPNTVQAVIRTRVHRLGREARSVLRLASVIGRTFTRELLRHILGDEAPLTAALDALRTAGLIQQIRVLPEATYRFKHALTQEVAYGSLLQHQRRRMHEFVGRALEAQHADHLEQHADVLAYHFGEAEHWRKAVHYSRVAAERAHRLSQYSEAFSLYEQAWTWMTRLPEDAERQQMRVELLLRKERLHDAVGGREEQQATIDELFARLDGAGDPETLAEVYIRQGDLHTLQGRFEKAEAALTEALRVSRVHTNGPGEQKALRSMGFLRWHQDRHGEALAINEKVLAIDRQRGDREALMTDLSNLVTVLRRLEDFDRGLSYAEELLVLNDQIEDPFRRITVFHNVSEIYRGLGDNDRALFYNDRAMELAEQAQYLLGQQSYGVGLRAQIFFEQGRVEESIRLYKQLIAMYRRGEVVAGPDGFAPHGLAGPLRVLGEILVALDRHDEARPYLEEAASLFARQEDRATEALLRRTVAEILERQEAFAAARAMWEQVRALYRDAGSAAGEGRALEGLARTARRQGHLDYALQCYRQALELAEQAGDDAAQGALHNTLGILAWKRGAYGDAHTHYEAALQIFEVRDEPAHAGLMRNSIGVTLQKLGRFEEAIRCLEDAVQRHRATEQQQLEAHALAALGDAHSEVGRYAEALPYYDASMQLRGVLDDRGGEGWMLQRLARTYSAQGENEHARDHAKRAAEIAEETEDEELLKACRRLLL